MQMLLRLFLFLVLLVPSLLNAQKTAEFGLLLGRSYYIGEINPDKHYGNGNGSFTYGAAFRYNLNKRYSLKATLLRTELQSSDIENPLLFNQARKASFTNQLTEFSGQIEFNFLPYETGDRDHFFSPYLFVGLSAYDEEAELQIDGADAVEGEGSTGIKMAYPFGMGMKLSLGRKLAFSFEWGFRKTSNDNIDGLPNRVAEIYEIGKEYDNDWYNVSAFILTYKLSKQGACPAYNF